MEDQDLDDLFADPLNESLNEEQIQQQLDNVTPVPAPAGLVERVNHLRLVGCNEHIAWSRIGSIAYISKDRREVHLCNLRFSNEKGDWIKSNHTDYNFPPHLKQVFKGRELAHLSWNPTSLELLVADVCGRIGLFSLAIALNRAVMAKVITPEQDDSMNALVGMTWLNQKRLVRLSKGATKVGDSWKPSLSSDGHKGIGYPTTQTGANKSAILAVNRKGIIILGYQLLEQTGWADIKHDLDGCSTSADVLTHAVIGPDTGDTSFLVVHTTSAKLRVYSLSIDWPINKAGGSNERPSPTIVTQYITSIDSCRPLTDSHWSIPPPELSKLEFLPRASAEKGESSHPTVVAAFVGSDSIGHSEPTTTLISRWELRDTPLLVDESFSLLASKRTAATELKQSDKRLFRLDDIRIDRVILQLTFQLHNDTIILTSTDGVVEYRDRKFEVLPMLESPDQVGSIPQLGFSLSNHKPCLHTALSPNGVLKAYMGREHELETAAMQLPTEMVDLGGVATLDKIAMAFAVANAVAEASTIGNSTNDDLIMVFFRFITQLPGDQENTVRTVFVRETYRILGVAEKVVDMSQFERNAKLGLIIRCLSLQAAVGNYGYRLNRTLASKLAMTALNVRHICVAYMLARIPSNRPPGANGPANPGGGANEPDINRTDVLQYLTNLTTWYLKLTDFVMSELFSLNRTLDVANGFDADALRLRVAASNSPALPLLCNQFTRALFRHTGLLLRSRLAPLTSKVAWAQPPSSTAQHWAAFSRACKSPSIAPPILESLLSELDERVHRVYSEANVSDSDRQDLELDILVRGELPDVLLGDNGPVAWLLNSAVERLRSGTVMLGGQGAQIPDRAEADLAFGNWAVLSIRDDLESRKWRRMVLYDGMQKRELGKRGQVLKVGNGPNDLRVRTCTRCGTSMEDFIPGRGKEPRTHPVFGSLRLCICNAHFVTERPEDLKKVVGEDS